MTLRRTPLVDAALDRAVTIPSATIHAHVDSIRRRNPEATPQEVVEVLEREYLLLVQGTGGAVGAAAAAGEGILSAASDAVCGLALTVRVLTRTGRIGSVEPVATGAAFAAAVGSARGAAASALGAGSKRTGALVALATA